MSKPKDPRPQMPKLPKMPDGVSDTHIANALKMAIHYADVIENTKAFKELKRKTDKVAGANPADMLAVVGITAGIVGARACKPLADAMTESIRLRRKYSVELALWKKRNGKTLTKEERLLTAVFGDDKGNLDNCEPTEKERKVAKKIADGIAADSVDGDIEKVAKIAKKVAKKGGAK